MMSKLFILLSMLFYTANAAVAIAELPEKPEEFADKEGCYISEVKDVIPFGTDITPLGNCIKIYCDTEMLRYFSCGVVYTSKPSCNITEIDLSKTYPDCCSKVKCDSENVDDVTS